jgi:two-component system LytT family response regulator
MENAIIIDDEYNVRKGLSAMLHEFCPKIKIVGEAASVREGVELINTLNPDLIFLDVQLPDGTGFDVLKAIGKSKVRVIFVTAYSEYALKAIKYSAIDYLLKPVIPEELIGAVDKATELIEFDQHFFDLNLSKSLKESVKPSKLVVKTKSELFYFDVSQIMYCQSDINYTQLFFNAHRPLVVAKTLKYYEDLLREHNFCRIHQSYVVNRRYAVGIRNEHLLLTDGNLLAISKKRRTAVYKWLSNN